MLNKNSPLNGTKKWAENVTRAQAFTQQISEYPYFLKFKLSVPKIDDRQIKGQ